ncbi:MAG: ABC transporter substrate-binding protein [Legionellaceae bacterium]|nr:ABC transporter substrate-binding protein [Legionellaceae bacterium]
MHRINIPCNLQVGVVGPFSGPRACYGDLLKQEVLSTGLQQYVDILWEDDAADPIIAGKIAHSLVKKGVFTVLGHFNSACARTAGSIYSSAAIPLLLPASTAIDLTECLRTFRLCPNDQDQIQSIMNFVSSHSFEHVAIWTDGSAYGLRLRDLIESQMQQTWLDPADLKNNSLLILLGAHHHVADFLLNLMPTSYNITALCCDDCSIEAFHHLVKDIPNIWVVTPSPDFRGCVRSAAELIISYVTMKTDIPFEHWLSRPDGPFLMQQHIGTQFVCHSFFRCFIHD